MNESAHDGKKDVLSSLVDLAHKARESTERGAQAATVAGREGVAGSTESHEALRLVAEAVQCGESRVCEAHFLLYTRLPLLQNLSIGAGPDDIMLSLVDPSHRLILRRARQSLSESERQLNKLKSLRARLLHKHVEAQLDERQGNIDKLRAKLDNYTSIASSSPAVAPKFDPPERPPSRIDAMSFLPLFHERVWKSRIEDSERRIDITSTAVDAPLRGVLAPLQSKRSSGSFLELDEREHNLKLKLDSPSNQVCSLSDDLRLPNDVGGGRFPCATAPHLYLTTYSSESSVTDSDMPTLTPLKRGGATDNAGGVAGDMEVSDYSDFEPSDSEP